MREILGVAIPAGTALVVVWLSWRWNAHRTWVLDNKKMEWRELVDAVEKALGGMGDAVYQKAEYPSKSVPRVFAVLKNRIFIADSVADKKLVDRWHQIVRHVNSVTVPSWRPSEESIQSFQREYEAFPDFLIALSREDLRIPSASRSRTAMNLKEGTRRLAWLLGAAGAILGGFASYAELQSVLSQKARHVRFEQVANSDAVRQAKPVDLSAKGDVPDASQTGLLAGDADRPTDPISEFIALPRDRQLALLRQLSPAEQDGFLAKVKQRRKSGIKTIHWTKGYGVESIETWDGQTLDPTPAPAKWSYFVIALFPVLGFFVVWGLVRAIEWVGAGFVASPR